MTRSTTRLIPPFVARSPLADHVPGTAPLRPPPRPRCTARRSGTLALRHQLHANRGPPGLGVPAATRGRRRLAPVRTTARQGRGRPRLRARLATFTAPRPSGTRPTAASLGCVRGRSHAAARSARRRGGDRLGDQTRSFYDVPSRAHLRLNLTGSCPPARGRDRPRGIAARPDRGVSRWTATGRVTVCSPTPGASRASCGRRNTDTSTAVHNPTGAWICQGQPALLATATTGRRSSPPARRPRRPPPTACRRPPTHASTRCC